jgi:hypothetical protein
MLPLTAYRSRPMTRAVNIRAKFDSESHLVKARREPRQDLKELVMVEKEIEDHR